MTSPAMKNRVYILQVFFTANAKNHTACLFVSFSVKMLIIFLS